MHKPSQNVLKEITMQVMDIKIRELRFTVRLGNRVNSEELDRLCLVDTDGDREIAKVLTDSYEWEDESPPDNQTYVIAPVTDKDLDTYRSNLYIERDAYKIALDKIRTRNLPMALTAVERTLDGRKMRFFFTADNRIDFRELVKDLAYVYKTRIEMRQIGVRDRSKKIGGYGICGQELCCSRFLQKFDPITIRMAKEQNLALNPTKISGLCGRLMCCLAYETNDYNSFRRSVPRYGTRVNTHQGKGTINGMNYVRETLSVELDDGNVIDTKLDNVSPIRDNKQ